ncbi:unnamed protein product [Echinostoma caproni]|uniref:Uncharacterized protein n=1 Tax=Echinostoma caproni TaxID=27848 RepID=A0A183A218_9TREM|nr:unnamed protein product [Echinostoma caproni]
MQHRQVSPPHQLSPCLNAFLRVDSVRKPLQQSYERPFRIISRYDKTFKVNWHGRVDTISTDRLKVAYVDENVMHASTKLSADPSQPLIETPVSCLGLHYSPAAPVLDEASASRLCWQPPQLATTPHEVSSSHLSRQLSLPATVLDELLASHSDRQPRATVTISDVSPVSCPSQPDAALSRPSNETSVSRSGRRIVLPARFRT